MKFSEEGSLLNVFYVEGSSYLRTIDVSSSGIIHASASGGTYYTFTNDGELLIHWKDEDYFSSNFPGIASANDGSIYFVKDQSLYKYRMNYSLEDQ